jgi:hypothetical protein
MCRWRIPATICVVALAVPTHGAAQSAPSEAVIDCGSKLAPMTPAIAAAFGLDRLRAFVEKPNRVEGSFASGDFAQSAVPTDPSATAVELTFELGEVELYEATADLDGCADSIRSAAHARVRIGDDVLAFEADGILWQSANEPAAHFQATADLATATGHYDPHLDASRIHLGQIEIALYVSPGHVRGSITTEAVYFDNVAQRVRYRRGRSSDYADQSVLFRLGFPRDRCADYELPFADDEAIELLRGQTADALRASVARRIGEQTTADAVWKSGDATRVSVELGEPARGGTACLGAARSAGGAAPTARWALGTRFAGRLTTADGRIDLSLHELVLSIDDDGVPRAELRAWVRKEELGAAAQQALPRDPDVLEAVVTYDFEQDTDARFGGIVRLHRQIGDNTFVPLDCVAFPPGGTQDLDDCRYRRPR